VHAGYTQEVMRPIECHVGDLKLVYYSALSSLSLPQCSLHSRRHLHSLKADTFAKYVNLTNNRRVKIGRQTNDRIVLAENNGYFNSKVLSWQHTKPREETGR
jgi:hypothetical protein